MRTLFYCINGILTQPGNAENWTTRTNSWINRHTVDGIVSDRYEYFCDILLRNVKQQKRVEEIALEVAKYRQAGYRIVLIGHSNGCALIGDVLSRCGQSIFAAHLFAPAAEVGVFEDAIREGFVKRIHIYGSKNDRALKIAEALGPVAKWVPWTGRYGSLGLHGPDFASRFPLTVTDHSNDSYDHGTWFTHGDIFNATMELIQANDQKDIQHEDNPSLRPNPCPCELLQQPNPSTAAGIDHC
jgi:hypothetical protein